MVSDHRLGGVQRKYDFLQPASCCSFGVYMAPMSTVKKELSQNGPHMALMATFCGFLIFIFFVFYVKIDLAGHSSIKVTQINILKQQ